ncbi:MAG: hypothetical protein ABIG85_01645, partial [Chloroflexota bacterium]
MCTLEDYTFVKNVMIKRQSDGSRRTGIRCMSGMPGARIPIDERTRILVLTGAGISAESGLATFRGAGGL